MFPLKFLNSSSCSFLKHYTTLLLCCFSFVVPLSFFRVGSFAPLVSFLHSNLFSCLLALVTILKTNLIYYTYDTHDGRFVSISFGKRAVGSKPSRKKLQFTLSKRQIFINSNLPTKRTGIVAQYSLIVKDIEWKWHCKRRGEVVGFFGLCSAQRDIS